MWLVLSFSISYQHKNLGQPFNTNEFANAQPPGTENNMTTSPSPGDNTTFDICHDNKSGFSISYNRSWYRSPDGCIYFSPRFDILSIDDIIEPFVRISVNQTIFSQPNITLAEVLAVVLDRTNRDLFQMTRPVTYHFIDGNMAFVGNYNWTRPDLVERSLMAGLPYVNLNATSYFTPRLDLSSNVSSSILPTDFGGVHQSLMPISTIFTTPEITTHEEQGAVRVVAASSTLTPPDSSPVPSSNATTPVPSSNATTPVPSSNATTPVPSPTPTGTPLILAKLIAIYTIHDRKVYVIEYASPLREFDRHLPTFLEMLSSFRFTK